MTTQEIIDDVATTGRFTDEAEKLLYTVDITKQTLSQIDLTDPNVKTFLTIATSQSAMPNAILETIRKISKPFWT